MFWPFTVRINCSSNLKIFANSQPSASNFKNFSQSVEQFFLTVGQNNFGNKMPFLQFVQPKMNFLISWLFDWLLNHIVTPILELLISTDIKCVCKCICRYTQCVYVHIIVIVDIMWQIDVIMLLDVHAIDSREISDNLVVGS